MQEYQVTLSYGANGWLVMATDTVHSIPLLFYGPCVSITEAMQHGAARIEEYATAWDAEQTGFRNQGIIQLVPTFLQPRTIQHTKDCQQRQAHTKAWYTLWPNHCKLCRAEGGKYFPGTREEPPDYDVCLCLNMGLCSRCMLPAQSHSPARVMAYELYDLLHTLDRHIREQLRVAHSPSLRSDIEWQQRYRIYADNWYHTTYRQLTDTAQHFVNLAEVTDPIDDDFDWDGTKPIKPCIHCGFDYGRRVNDLPAGSECYCEME